MYYRSPVDSILLQLGTVDSQKAKVWLVEFLINFKFYTF